MAKSSPEGWLDGDGEVMWEGFKGIIDGVIGKIEKREYDYPREVENLRALIEQFYKKRSMENCAEALIFIEGWQRRVEKKLGHLWDPDFFGIGDPYFSDVWCFCSGAISVLEKKLGIEKPKEKDTFSTLVFGDDLEVKRALEGIKDKLPNLN